MVTGPLYSPSSLLALTSPLNRDSSCSLGDLLRNDSGRTSATGSGFPAPMSPAFKDLAASGSLLSSDRPPRPPSPANVLSPRNNIVPGISPRSISVPRELHNMLGSPGGGPLGEFLGRMTGSVEAHKDVNKGDGEDIGGEDSLNGGGGKRRRPPPLNRGLIGLGSTLEGEKQTAPTSTKSEGAEKQRAGWDE
mmetsp:Transcript_72577/g.170698  ORF Transcript_72577/g.170698 Transcript_72577/m.170698 type:complete len:192 (+) Transcript_72577:1233-1808(+)